MNEQPGWPAARLIDGLEAMAQQVLRAPSKPIREDDLVRVCVAINGGNVWRNARVIDVELDNFQRRKFKVAVNGPTAPVVFKRVDEVSVRRS